MWAARSRTSTPGASPSMESPATCSRSDEDTADTLERGFPLAVTLTQRICEPVSVYLFLARAPETTPGKLMQCPNRHEK